jgi:hypothetical protein
MIIPDLQGKLSCQDYFVYGACDDKYFDEFGKVLIASIKANSNDNIHIHIFNPRDDQLDFCRNNNVSFTYEFAPLELFEPASNKWNTVPVDPVDKHNYDRIITAMSKGNDSSIIERIQKTYFACARFIRLNQILNNDTVAFSIDVDAVVRSAIPKLSIDKDLYIHHITGKKARFLAGGVYINPNGRDFLKEYAAILELKISEDLIHWGLDQDVLDPIVPKYNYASLPIRYIDWHMMSDSYIWTAKGSRKETAEFISEQKKYIS